MKIKNIFLAYLIFTISNSAFAIESKIHILVWSEGNEPVSVYPHGINGAIAKSLSKDRQLEVYTASFLDKDYGLNTKTLSNTDVLIWYADEKHSEIPNIIAKQIARRVHAGMGLIALHGASTTKPFKELFKSSGTWKEYRTDGKAEKIMIVDSKHPLARGLKNFVLPQTQIFVEPFNIQQPNDVVMEGVWTTGEKSREVMA